MTGRSDYEAEFWHHAEPLLEQAGVTRSTMMGLPCLRIDGAFFASWDRATGALLIKLAEADVDELVAAGTADSFSPAGRRFREWASITPERHEQWPELLDRALQYVSQLPPKPVSKRRR